VANVADHEPPEAIWPESNFAGPDFCVTVCGTVSSLTHVTVVPSGTVTAAGAKA
jgi:hypothetical protein